MSTCAICGNQAEHTTGYEILTALEEKSTVDYQGNRIKIRVTLSNATPHYYAVCDNCTAKTTKKMRRGRLLAPLVGVMAALVTAVIVLVALSKDPMAPTCREGYHLVTQNIEFGQIVIECTDGEYTYSEYFSINDEDEDMATVMAPFLSFTMFISFWPLAHVLLVSRRRTSIVRGLKSKALHDCRASLTEAEQNRFKDTRRQKLLHDGHGSIAYLAFTPKELESYMEILSKQKSF